MPQMERVLILSASYGDGHQQAASAVAEALVQRSPDVDVRTIDYLKTVHPIVNSVARFCYLKSVRFVPQLYGLFYKSTSKITSRSLIQRQLDRLGLEEFADYLRAYQPSIVLSTFPVPSGVMSVVRERGLFTVPSATVITDHTVHSQWIHPNTDHYFVGSEHVRQGLIRRGIPASRVTVTGIPIRPAFLSDLNRSQIRANLGLTDALPTLLIMAGAYGVTADITHICEALFQSPIQAQVIVVCGRNEKLRTQVDEIATRATNPVRVYGYSTVMHELMAISDLIITKAGGLTVSEALAMELPMIVYRPIPGQEVQNAIFLVKSRVAVLARSRQDVVVQAERLLSEGHRLARMRAATNTIRKATAAADIAEQLLQVEVLPAVRPREQSGA
jgi:processive 1,2-diacylglycerol beta-glucosyltransferase